MAKCNTTMTGLITGIALVLSSVAAIGCGRDAPAREASPESSLTAEQAAGADPGRAGRPQAQPRAVAGPAGAPKAQAPPTRPNTASGLAESLVTHLRRVAALKLSLVDDSRKTRELEAARLKRFRKLVLSIYGGRDYAPLVSRGDELLETGKLAAELILDVESHGIEPSPYPINALKAALGDYEEARSAVAAITNQAADGTAAAAKLALILQRVTRNEDEPYADFKQRLEVALLGRGLVDGPDNARWLGELRRWTSELQAARKNATRALARLDVLVLQGALQYSLDFKHLKVAHPFDAVSPAEKLRAPRTYSKRLKADVLAAGDQLGTAMQGWWPKHPYYAKARGALKRYRGYVKEKTVPGWAVRGTVRKGHKGKRVLALKKRLAAEGYFEGPLDQPKFGVELEAAVKRYQAHHQLKEDGIVRNSFGLAGLTRTSLAVPMSARARQIKLSLQRWRESVTHREDFYFRVNVPQFEVEVWDGDELVRKHRLIVGNNKFEVDPDQGRKGHLNRTALISKAINKVVINPVWHVPERIKNAEIMVEVLKDPDYLRKHGYNVRTLSSGRQIISQAAGPGNALGRVKLLFPNKHSIYMHDTPKKRLFKRTIRAFSHGCMRLQDPIDMATYLLDRQGIMDKADVQRVLATKKERGVILKEKVPIHIEYNTIAFEPDSEDPLFLNDVYKYDRRYHEGKLPLLAFERIPIVKTESPPIVLDEDGRVILPGAENSDETPEDPGAADGATLPAGAAPTTDAAPTADAAPTTDETATPPEDAPEATSEVPNEPGPED